MKNLTRYYIKCEHCIVWHRHGVQMEFDNFPPRFTDNAQQLIDFALSHVPDRTYHMIYTTQYIIILAIGAGPRRSRYKRRLAKRRAQQMVSPLALLSLPSRWFRNHWRLFTYPWYVVVVLSCWHRLITRGGRSRRPPLPCADRPRVQDRWLWWGSTRRRRACLRRSLDPRRVPFRQSRVDKEVFGKRDLSTYDFQNRICAVAAVPAATHIDNEINKKLSLTVEIYISFCWLNIICPPR